METIEANALYRLGKLSSDAIVVAANQWLNDGLYSKSLGELCTMGTPEMANVGPLFESAMRELGIANFSRIEAAFFMVRTILKRISEGKMNPVEGAEFLYWHVHHELQDELPDQRYAGDSLGLGEVFCWLREIWDCRDGSMILYHTDLPRDQAEKKFIEHLIDTAREWKKKDRTTTASY